MDAATYWERIARDVGEWNAGFEGAEGEEPSRSTLPAPSLRYDEGMSALHRAMYEADMRLWAETHITLEDGSRLSFERRPWMRQIWDDTTPQIAMQKPTQVGATVWAMCLALHRAAVLGQVGIFTMPTAADVSDFVAGRLDRVLDNSPYLASLMGRGVRRTRGHGADVKDNSKVKHVGRGTLYFRGTQTARAAVSVPAHFLVHDELDLSVPEILEMYGHRLDALPAELWQIYHMSTPTVPGFGINQRYLASNAYTWLIRCPACGRWQSLDYWEQTRGYLDHLACPRCSATLDPSLGYWVEEHPALTGQRHGYKLSRLMLCTPDEAGRSLLVKLHERRAEARFQRHFVNMDLAEVSSEGAITISRTQMLGACFDETYAYPAEFAWHKEPLSGPYYMGVDQGDTLTVTVGRRDPARDGARTRIVLVARLRDPERGSEGWERLARLMDAYQIAMCVVDANPNSASSHDLAKKFPGRVLVCYYRDGQRTQVQVSADVEKAAQSRNSLIRSLGAGKVDNTTHVDISVERTEALDITAQMLISGGFMLPGPATNLHPEVEEFLRQVENNVRRPVEDRRTGETVFRWDRKGPDHFLHSLNYLRLAAEEGQRLRSLGQNATAPVVVRGVSTPAPRRR